MRPLFILPATIILSITLNAQIKMTSTPQRDEITGTDYLIVAGTSTDFNALRNSALALGQKLNIPYTDLERVYHDSCITLSDTSSDELYRGSYIFRRFTFNEISIELNVDGIYFNPSESKEKPMMMIVAGMFPDKKEAYERLALVKKYIPGAYLKKKEVYMGCIH
ncbi:MAG TPA: hypothetical protein VI112_00650 [Bacteroidia bacterium]|jgi:hypothetical protein